MERKTLLPMDSKIFEDMGIKMVKKEDGDLSIKYSYRKKERLQREHLPLTRNPGESVAPGMGHYYLQLFITGWNDSRGKYHWPYDVYAGAFALLVLGMYLVAGNLPNTVTMVVFLVVTAVGTFIGWFLEWWNNLYRKVTLHETKMENIKDAITYDPNEMNMDKRYGTINADFTEMNTYSIPEDFFWEFVLVIGGIQLLDKRKKPHIVVNNHVANIAVGPGITGMKFSNLVLIRGLPSVTIVPKNKETAFSALNTYAANNKISNEDAQRAHDLVEETYTYLSASIARQEELEQIMGKDFLKIDIQDDFLYAYFTSAERVSEESMRKYREFIERGGSMEQEAVRAVNEAKLEAEKERDFPVMLKNAFESGLRTRIGRERGPQLADKINESILAQDRSFNEHVATGKEAAAKKEEIPDVDIIDDYLSKIEDE